MKQFTLHTIHLEIRAPCHWSDGRAAKCFDDSVRIVEELIDELKEHLRMIDPELKVTKE